MSPHSQQPIYTMTSDPNTAALHPTATATIDYTAHRSHNDLILQENNFSCILSAIALLSDHYRYECPDAQSTWLRTHCGFTLWVSITNHSYAYTNLG
jgi:hypothetical protein